MPCLCNYCQDTLLVDKNGNPKGQHKGTLISCPMCQKDKKIETIKLDVNIEDVLKENTRLKAAWTLELLPSWPKNHVEALVEKFGLMVMSKNKITPATFGGMSKDNWYKIEFHGSMPYEMIKQVLSHLRVEQHEYRFVIDKLGGK